MQSESSSTNSLPARGAARFGLRFLLLFITCAGSWIAYFTQQRSITSEISRIERLHQFAPQLFVRDLREYACLEIKREEDNVHEYHCFLPEGKQYQLNLKWKDAFLLREPTKPDLTHSMKPGTYKIYFEVTDRLRVRVEDQVIFDEPYTDPAKRSSYSVVNAGTSFRDQWKPIDKPLVLLSRTEFKPGTDDNPAEGVSLWIESGKENAKEKSMP